MSKAQIGVYGLGTMGSALALNLAENGVRVAVANRETEWLAPFMEEAGPLASQITPTETLAEFVAAVDTPRTLLFMIPSGAPVDGMIAEIRPLLAEGDTIIDGGNSDFNDTRRRFDDLETSGLHFVGMGVSGGEEGARHGPSMMVGGSDHSWQQLRPMVEAIAAKFNGDPCVAHVGPDGAGHFVKTVHNGIEYADMQIIAEIYGLLRDGEGWDAARIGALFGEWNEGPLASYLVEITSKILAAGDPDTGVPMVDMILDSAGQKGTGRWTVIEALKLGHSATVIEAAVAARSWSADPEARLQAGKILAGPTEAAKLPSTETLRAAFLAARVLAHAQGFALLTAASKEFDWSLDLSRIAEIWRAGCIIRSALLDELAAALRTHPGENLALAPAMAELLAKSIGPLRETVAAAALSGLPVPSLASALNWYDSLRRAPGTANLIQAQRDFFGAHGFIRTDRPGATHGPWHQKG